MKPINASPESQESSSPTVSRAVASALLGEACEPYIFTGPQKAALKVLGALPQSIGRVVISRIGSQSSIPAESIRDLDIEDLVKNRLADYDRITGRYPAITIGVAQGGATAHLALALGGPFLPQAFVLSLKGGSPDGSVKPYFDRCANLARSLAANNREIITIQHYDPVHDGWLTRNVNHLRLKLIDLPDSYRAFILERLEPGGEVCYLDGQASWLRYQVGERSFFQVGGWGDIPPDEFLEGSERIFRVGRSEGLTRFDWRLDGFPLVRGPESEWGSEAGLGEALEAFCSLNGYRFKRIAFPEPNGFSRLAFAAVRRILEKEHREAPGILIETFSQFDTTAVRRSGLLPVWLIFNTMDSLGFLREMVTQFPPGKPVFFSPLSTFSRTPDMAAWQEWENALTGLDWVNIGARMSHYPADTRALVEWNRPLRRWVEQHADPLRERISLDEIGQLACDIRREGEIIRA